MKRVHFVGIGGVGMSALAALLARQGATVTGSDLADSDVFPRLRARGIGIAPVGHRRENVPDCDAVVHTAAVPQDNVELVEARRRGIPLVRRAVLLGKVLEGHRGIAVAGSHGKTTTTAMTGSVLRAGGLDPTILVGGDVRGSEDNLHVGAGACVVTEADEYDRAFLELKPEVAVVTNVDREHLDTYPREEDLHAAFAAFCDATQPRGLAILGIDDAGVRAVAARTRARCETFGLAADARVRAIDVERHATGTRFQLVVGGAAAGWLQLRVPGLHNVRNALAAATVGLHFGVSVAAITAALADYAGVRRRFEILGERGGVTVVDDYAHHPTEIAATLQAAAQAYPGRRRVVAFQPHLFTRTRDQWREFATVLADADVVRVMPIYPAREQPLAGVTSALIVDALLAQPGAVGRRREPAALVADEADLFRRWRDELRPGDVLITMGAGDITAAGRRWIAS